MSAIYRCKRHHKRLHSRYPREMDWLIFSRANICNTSSNRQTSMQYMYNKFGAMFNGGDVTEVRCNWTSYFDADNIANKLSMMCELELVSLWTKWVKIKRGGQVDESDKRHKTLFSLVHQLYLSRLLSFSLFPTLGQRIPKHHFAMHIAHESKISVDTTHGKLKLGLWNNPNKPDNVENQIFINAIGWKYLRLNIISSIYEINNDKFTQAMDNDAFCEMIEFRVNSGRRIFVLLEF